MDNETGSIEDAKQSIVDEFSLFDSWIDRYEYIVELGRNLPDLPENCRTDQYKVKGCQSQVWFRAREESGQIIFGDERTIVVPGEDRRILKEGARIRQDTPQGDRTQPNIIWPGTGTGSSGNSNPRSGNGENNP